MPFKPTAFSGQALDRSERVGGFREDMPASNPTYGKCSDGNLQKTRDSRGRFHLFCLAAVGGGRSHCIAVERFCWFAVNLAFALQGLAHFFKARGRHGSSDLADSNNNRTQVH